MQPSKDFQNTKQGLYKGKLTRFRTGNNTINCSIIYI